MASIAALAVVAAVAVWNPLVAPEPWIEHWLRGKFPPGSSIVDLRLAAEAQHWRTSDQWLADGGSLVHVLLGRDRITRRFVSAQFRFDRFGQLRGLEVLKTAGPAPAGAARPGP